MVWNIWIIFPWKNIGDVILPIDELHHFSRWLQHVKTTNQNKLAYLIVGTCWSCFCYEPPNEIDWEMTTTSMCRANFGAVVGSTQERDLEITGSYARSSGSAKSHFLQLHHQFLRKGQGMAASFELLRGGSNRQKFIHTSSTSSNQSQVVQLS